MELAPGAAGDCSADGAVLMRDLDADAALDAALPSFVDCHNFAAEIVAASGARRIPNSCWTNAQRHISMPENIPVHG